MASDFAHIQTNEKRNIDMLKNTDMIKKKSDFFFIILSVFSFCINSFVLARFVLHYIYFINQHFKNDTGIPICFHILMIAYKLQKSFSCIFMLKSC